MNYKYISLAIVALIFFAGSSAIVYYGRPVMQIDTSSAQEMIQDSKTTEIVSGITDDDSDDDSEETDETHEVDEVSEDDETGTTEEAGTYTFATVQKHNLQDDCWATIDQNVYDLSSWVSRHPGGSRAIISICGTDASDDFAHHHGGSRVAKAALLLLKIGTLAE